MLRRPSHVKPCESNAEVRADCSADCSAPGGKPVVEPPRAESLVIPPVRARIVIALALVGTVAGCQESGFDESKETQRPLKVQHAMDQLTGTKVPGQAERPLTLTADALGDTLALGVEPVGGPRAPAYLREAARGVPRVADDDVAAIEATDPDVILGSKEAQGD